MTRAWRHRIVAAMLLLLVALALTLLMRSGMDRAPSPAPRDGELYAAWRAGPAAGDVADLEALLHAEGVGDVVPLADMLRSDVRWRRCRPALTPFAVPPRDQWRTIIPTLRYVRDHVVPVVGEVRVVSGYRSAAANGCFRGARHSRHLRFAALDLEPAGPMPRAELARLLCALHARTGQAQRVGLGIYARTRFHIDTAGYRRWGADYRATSSPCAPRE